jgi:hypothetical protein
MIPTPAAHQIFKEVWSEYSALIESDHHDSDASHFILDVQFALRTLYPQPAFYDRIHDALLNQPHKILPSTRSALGDTFLARGVWPVPNYFTNANRK